MLLRIIITVLVLAGVAGGVYLLKQQQIDARARVMASGPPPATITATRVLEAAWAARIEAVGTLTAVQDVAVAPEVTGKVVTIAFDSGAMVNENDVLVRLDDADDRALLKSLEAELALAQVENERVSKLRGSAAFSQSQLDRTRAQMASLAARVERQRVLVSRKLVRAPFAGALGIRRVSLGTIVQPGEPIVSLQSLAPIYVDFTVPERHRGALAVDASLSVRVAAWSGESFPGTVTVVSPAVDVRSRTLELRGELDNADLRLQPGMFAQVDLILGAAEPVLTLPRTAINFFAYGESVFVIDDSSEPLRVQRQPVRVGRTRQGRIEILSGLAVGQRVVHTGHNKLRDGQAVVIAEGVPLPKGVLDG